MFVGLVVLMNSGTLNNVLATLDSSELEEFAEHVISILNTMVLIVSVISDSMVTETNVMLAMQAVANVLVHKLTTA